MCHRLRKRWDENTLLNKGPHNVLRDAYLHTVSFKVAFSTTPSAFYYRHDTAGCWKLAAGRRPSQLDPRHKCTARRVRLKCMIRPCTQPETRDAGPGASVASVPYTAVRPYVTDDQAGLALHPPEGY
jgi:hypothetical protein